MDTDDRTLPCFNAWTFDGLYKLASIIFCYGDCNVNFLYYH